MEILTGKIRQVEPDGVWIRVDMTAGQAARLCTKATDEVAVGFRDGRTISPEQRRKGADDRSVSVHRVRKGRCV